MPRGARRSWAGRHRRASRCVPLGGHRQGRLRERDIRVPACHNVWSIWQEQHCHKRITSYGSLRLAWPLLPHGADHAAGHRGLTPAVFRWMRPVGAGPAPDPRFVAGSGPRSQATADRELLVVYSVIREVREVARYDGSTVALVFAPDC
jgi:hypothetical protein